MKRYSIKYSLMLLIILYGFTDKLHAQPNFGPGPNAPAAFCSAGTTWQSEFISSVKVGSIYNISGRGNSNGYNDYTARWTAMTKNVPYTITVNNGFPYSTDQCAIYVDWNQNQVFTDAGEAITVTGTAGVGPYTATITPPTTATNGACRMRIRIAGSGSFNSCGTTDFGEVEDYTIYVSGTADTSDIGVVQLLKPVTGTNLTANDTVRVLIYNFGTYSKSNFQVSYRINNGIPVTETCTATVTPGNTILYTFNQLANLSQTGGTYSINTYTTMTGDQQTANDGITTYVYHGYDLNQTIIAAEYFINTDPGQGNGTEISGTFNQHDVTLNINDVTVPVNSTIYVRVKSNMNIWSYPRGVKQLNYFPNANASLVYAEYFTGSDPGQGNATPVVLNNGVVNLNSINIPVGTRFYLRVKDNFNRWSNPYGYKRPAEWPNSGATLVYAEYYKNTDPGLGLANSIPINNGQLILNNLNLHQNDLIFMRVKDSYDRWSASTAFRYHFKGLVKADYKIGKNSTTILPMTLVPPVDSTCTYQGLKDNIAVNATDTVFVRFQSADGIYSTWKPGVRANAGNDKTICQGAYASLTASGGSSYIWNNGLAGATIQVNPGVSTLYWVTVSDGSGAWSVDSAMVFVNPYPGIPSPIVGPDNACKGSSVFIYSVPLVPNATSYTWTLPSGVTGSSTTNTITATFNTSATSGHISVKGTNNCGNGPVTSLPVTVYNAAAGVAGSITGSQNVVQGQNAVPYSVIPISNAASFQWTLPPGASIVSGSGTNSITVNYGSSAGSGNITVMGMNACGNGSSSSISVNVAQGQEIYGSFAYNNITSTPLDSLWVILKQNGNSIDSCRTNLTGNYHFYAKAPGTYTMSAKTHKPWMGVNSTDAVKVLRHFTGIETFSIPLRIEAGDVNSTGYLNAADALLIQQRFVGIINSFVTNDWVFEKPVGGNSLTLGTVNLMQDFWGLCTGDVNGSNIPIPGAKLTPTVQLNYSGELNITPGSEFELPLCVSQNMEISGISLVISYPCQKLELLDVTGPDENLIYKVADGNIRISWASINPVSLHSNDYLLKFRFKHSGSNDEPVISLETGNELADGLGEVIENAELWTPKIQVSSDHPVNLLQVYPNPARNAAHISFSLGEDCQVEVALFNMIGERLQTLDQGSFEKGLHYYDLDLQGYPGSILLVRLQAKTPNKVIIENRKLIIAE